MCKIYEGVCTKGGNLWAGITTRCKVHLDGHALELGVSIGSYYSAMFLYDASCKGFAALVSREEIMRVGGGAWGDFWGQNV